MFFLKKEMNLESSQLGEVIYLFGKPSEPTEAAYRLSACTPVLVLFPFFGRNAWQAKWIKRYQAGSLQASRREAENYIEGRLKQGSNWGFQILPAFHLQFDGAAYLLCEINAQAPFRNLLDSSLLRPGRLKAQCIEGLNPSSKYWAKGQKRENGIIVQETSRKADDFRSFSERTFDARHIWTIGTYKRQKCEFGDWGFDYVNDAIDLKFFETAMHQIANAPAR